MINGLILAAVAVVSAANGLDTEGLPLWRQLLFIPLAVASYLHGRQLPSAWERAVLAASFAAVAVTGGLLGRGEGLAVLFSLTLGLGLPWLAGRFRRQHAELVAAGRGRVAQLEREQAFIAGRARLRERARIAEDVHDSLGHALALMALRAGALEVVHATVPLEPAATEVRPAADEAAGGGAPSRAAKVRP